MWLTPARRRGVEMLDDPAVDPALAERSLRDVALANRLFGGRHAILREVRTVLHGVSPGTAVQLLDVGTGLGDIPRAAMQMAQTRAIPLRTVGLELTPRLASVAGRTCSYAVAADATRLPFADRSVDIVTCSQVLHHFEAAEAMQLLQECVRVASRAVIIGDLRRSWLAVAGLWTSSFALGFHPVSRHDGVVSILRGFTKQDLQQLFVEATGHVPRVRRSLGWRVTATVITSHT